MVKITSSENQPEHFAKKEVSGKQPSSIGKYWWLIIGILFLGSVGLAIDLPATRSTQTTSERQSEQRTVEPLTEEDRIKKLVEDELKGNNNLKEPYLRKVRVIGQIDGGWGVFVDYNASDNLSTSLRKRGIESKMSEIYIALYTSKEDIRTASVTAYFPLIDSFGNESENVVYKSMLDKDIADKVNWNANSSMLKLNILPGVWTTSLLHPEFR